MKLSIIVAILILPLAQAIDECSGNMHYDEVPCLLLLPVNTSTTACNTVSASIYNESTLLYTQTMHDYTSFLCNATFINTGYGTYSVTYSTGDSASLVVEEDENNIYYFYVTVFFIFFALLALGFYTTQPIFIILSGMLAMVTAVNLWIRGFPNLTNTFLINSIVIIVAGIGFYLVLVPSIQFFEEWKT